MLIRTVCFPQSSTTTYPDGGGSYTGTTDYSGLATTTTRTLSAGISPAGAFQLSKQVSLLNGLTEKTCALDQDGDGLPEETTYATVPILAAPILPGGAGPQIGERHTETQPNTATIITDRNLQRRLTSVTGTAVPPVSYAYGLTAAAYADGIFGFTVTITRPGPGTAVTEFKVHTYDPAGRISSTTYSALGGVTPPTAS